MQGEEKLHGAMSAGGQIPPVKGLGTGKFQKKTPRILKRQESDHHPSFLLGKGQKKKPWWKSTLLKKRRRVRGNSKRIIGFLEITGPT